jgi:hypothetical protein
MLRATERRRTEKVSGSIFRQGWGWGGGKLLQGMWRWIPVGSDAVVGKVGNSFGDGTEIRWRFTPAHGEDKGKGNQWLFIREGWKGDAKDWDIRRTKPDTVETIGEINLDHVNRAMLGWSKPDMVEQAVESKAKLHGFFVTRRRVASLTPEKIPLGNNVSR